MNEDMKKSLTELGLTEEQIGKMVEEGATTPDDLKSATPEEIKTITGCGLFVAKKIVSAFTVVEKPIVAEPVSQSMALPTMDILPQVPDDTSFLAMLKIGGDLKVGTTEIIAAIRAALADKSGLYDLPKILSTNMENFAETQENPCGPEFYKLQKMMTRRNYADIFYALEIDSASVTQVKKDKLLKRLNDDLWPALLDYHQCVSGWFQSWQQGVANPNAMMMAMASIASGVQGGLPAGIMQPPDTDVLRDGAESVINKINRVFSGTGIVIARALAVDANQIKEVLENKDLPSQIGATNHEQMLKILNVNVTPDYVRLERNITRYALSVMEFPKIDSGQAEYGYLTALFQLGNQIPWEKLSGLSAMPTNSKKNSGNEVNKY